MAWIKINQPLHEGQFIRLNVQFTRSSFSKEIAVTNASYSLKYSDLHDYQRDDTFIKANSVGKIMSPFDRTDGSYSVRFENDSRHTNNELKPDYFFDGNGPKVKIFNKELLEKADVWVD
jgi:hypothetical protein